MTMAESMFPIWALPLALLTLVYKVVGRLIYNHARRTTTALDDIPALGQSRPSGKKIGGTAIVAGGRCVPVGKHGIVETADIMIFA
jgi:hypothetical protein